MSIKILYHGHSNLEIHSGPHRIQLDPFYTGNPLADIPADQANPTHILLSHAHSDHTGDTISIAKRTNAPIAANYEICLYLQKHGAPSILPMNHGGGINLPFGRATMTIAFHTSSFDDGAYGGQPAGWIIEMGGAGGKTIYFAGDTALFSDMKLIGELWNIDLACLPIGDNFTMGPAHAIKAAQFLKPKHVLPIHYNTFPPITQDPQKFATDLLAQTGIHPLPLKPGESFTL
ncbi:MAG TPA: metal-dependent hydrolase [Phycisphaerae bacterium]|nr:metal-dependent hydrolase [Phycisphaerae bacterium]